MCLREIYTDEDMNRIVEELPEVVPGVVEVWKATFEVNSGFQGGVETGHFRFAAGICTAEKVRLETDEGVGYFSGFHCFFRRYAALRLCVSAKPYNFSPIVLIKCYTKKEWITAVGQNYVAKRKNKKTTRTSLVASQAFFPTYPETEAKLEDFLAWENEPVLEMAK